MDNKAIISPNEFLNFKINECLPKFREEHKEEYAVIFDLMQLLKSIEDKFVGKYASQQSIFLFSAVIEINRLFQSAILLLERGLSTSAKIITRTILELSIKIVEMVKNKEFIQEVLFDEIGEARSTVRAAERYNRTDLIPPEKIQEIEETYSSLKKDKSYKKKRIEDLAKKNGLEIEYLLYKTYCSSTHISASTLGKNFKHLSAGIVFDAGVQLDNFKNDLCSLIGIVLISIPCLTNEYFNDDNLMKKYDLICDNFQKEFNNFPTLLTAPQAAIKD